MMTITALLVITLLVCTNAFQVQTSRSSTTATPPPLILFSLKENDRHENGNDCSSSSSSSMRYSDGTTTSRRNALSQAAAAISGAALASFLLNEDTLPAFAAADAETNGGSVAAVKTIVVTGSNSGVGFEACKKLATQGHTIVLACRNIEKAQGAVERILASSLSSTDAAGASGKLIPAACDLSDLASVQSFAKQLPSLLGGGGGGGTKLDALCLNAGLARNAAAEDIVRTKDGFELTVGVNHFGHFYLNSLLLPMMNPDGGKIVVTASSVHDPDGPGGAQGVPAGLGTMQGLEQLGKDCEMIDGSSFNADKAYKDSKLCNVLFTRELQRRLSASSSTNKVTANCFSPGLILESGFFRDQSPVFTKVFDFAATKLFKVTETSEYGGGCLAYMVNSVGGESGGGGGQFYNSPPGTSSKYGESAYGNQFGPTPVSKEAMDDAKAKRLWELSEKVLGLS